MGLREYLRKRKFTKTPEPKGAVKQSHGRLRFVVQEHDATRLHYDFRLELDGVLKSWAIPKGPSLDPREHHLAVQTEDHPFGYRNFEGVIPEGNYGAGNVIVWDEGWYEARQGELGDGEKTLRKELSRGHLTFVLHGKKLKGEFALIKMKNTDDEKAWLLVKKADEFASTADVIKEDRSVKTRRTVDEVGSPSVKDYPKVTKPWRVSPMLCTLVEEPFDRKDWLFEIKWDGYRAIGSKYKSNVELYSRNQKDFSRYDAVIEALRSMRYDVVLDGEITVVDRKGVSHFEWLQNYMRRGDSSQEEGSLQYQIFDILWCDGYDVRSMPLYQRKALLSSILPTSDVLKYSDHVETKGQALFKEMQRQGLEGMVAKRADSSYQEGVRGEHWLKIKTHLRQEVVIGGYTEPRGSRQYLGALLVGIYENGVFKYVGHSGGGIPDEQRRQLRDKLAKLERKTSPFSTKPKPNAPVHWVRPELVCEMSFTEWTSEGYMRHPQYEGMRVDKKPTAVHIEKPKEIKGATKVVKDKNTLPFEPTHLDKIFFPKHKYTKGDLLTYYETMAPYILPYLKDRPLSLNRMPDGINGMSFFQKNNEHLPDWVPYVDILSDSNKADLRWIKGGDLHTLLYVAQLGSIELNPWNSRVDKLDNPDWVVIDLDPEGMSFENVIEVARTVKDVCDELHILSYPKTSGKTGLHIYIPLAARYTFEQAKNFAHLIVLEVNKRQPTITSVERMPEKRKHKIYLDFLQNREGQTLAAPYSVRPTPDASVSTPLHWDEVKIGLKPTDFTIKNIHERVKREGDLWKPVMGKGIDILKVLKQLEALNEES